MTKISIITTSIYDNLDDVISITVPSLISQTYKDFKWYYFDGQYKQNKKRFNELFHNLPFEVIHAPLLNDWTRPHSWHWEPYNSAVALIDTDYFLRWGRSRQYWPKAIEHSVKFIESGYMIDFVVSVSPNNGRGHDMVDMHLPWEVNIVDDKPSTNSGMFGMNRDDFINKLNGNCEVSVHWMHHEDVELSTRMRFLDMKCKRVHGGLRRFFVKRNRSKLEDCPPDRCGDPYCSSIVDRHYENVRDVLSSSDISMRIMHDGFDFWFCTKCGSVSVGCTMGYFKYLNDRGSAKSPIGINLVGRNLRKLADDVAKLKIIEDKFELIKNSFSNRKYCSA